MSISERLIVIIDVGTTGVKALLISESGKILGKTYTEYSLITPSPTEVEQDANLWWSEAKNAIKELMKKAKPMKSSITSISITNQRGTVVPVDKDGNPLCNAITWLDTRTPETDEDMKKRLIQRSSLQKILWLKQNKPEIFKKTHKFVTTDAFIYYKLTGNFVMSSSNAIYYPYNVMELKWDEELINELDLSLDLFPETVPSGSDLGKISEDAAEELCLPKGINVIMGAGDQQSSMIGVGAIKPNIAKATTGTGTFVDVTLEEPIFDFYDTTTHLFVLPHAIEKKWILEAVIPGTGALLKWYRDNFAYPEVEEAKHKGMNAYDIITKYAEKEPPGVNGLGIIPLFTFGKGLIYGLSLSHTRHSIARAILESNGFAIRFFLDMFEEFEQKITELRVDGGGVKSSLWRQIQADITEKPVVLTNVIEDAGPLGAAILAAKGIGLYSSLESAVNNMVRLKERRDPNPENSEKYMEYYERFQDMMLSVASELEV